MEGNLVPTFMNHVIVNENNIYTDSQNIKLHGSYLQTDQGIDTRLVWRAVMNQVLDTSSDILATLNALTIFERFEGIFSP